MNLAGSLRAVVVGTAISLFASTGALAQRYTFRQYGSAEGLSNLSATCLLQDRTGYIWVGTDNGLFRYDGTKFTEFGHAAGLPNSEILGLAESPDGVLWVATQGGVVRRFGARFKLLEGSEKEAYQGVAFDSKGRVYLQHNAGIVLGEPNGKGWYRFSDAAQGPLGALSVSGEDVWFSRDKDVWHLEAGKIERIGSPAGLPKAEWSAIAKDLMGNLWVRSADRLYELPHKQSRFIDRSEGIASSSRPRLFADSHGRMFVPSDSGVIIFDGANRTFLDPEHGLPADSVAPVLLDRQETLWMGMFGGGVVRRLGHGEWLSWKKDDGLLHNSVWTIMHGRDGRLWVGTSGGLSIFGPDGKLEDSWNAQSGLAGDWIRSVVESPTGDVLVGTFPGGISRFKQDGTLLGPYAPKAKIDHVLAMAIDHQSRLWVLGSAAGVLRSTAALTAKSEPQFELMKISGLPSDAIFRDLLVGSDGIVWISTSRGLARFDGSHWRLFTDADGLTSADLSALAENHGTIWAGYRDALGIARLRWNGGRPEVTSITTQNGLSSDLIYAMAFDSKGRLWATTDNGIDVFDQGQWLHYDREDGLIWDDGNDLALSTDRQGNVWIGTSGGLSRLAPLPYPIPVSAPPVVLTSIESGTQQFQTGDRPVLPHAQDSLLIRFSSLNYASETSSRFRYRLLGSNNSWKETRERSVRFEGLPGGRYTFEVIAAGLDGLWSPVPARFSFFIKPPWWQTWWFVAACIMTAGFLAVALWKFRVRTLVAQKELLKQRVADQTAELIKSHRQLEQLAYFDMLTSLPNRRMFAEKFRARLALARRQSAPFALLLVDLDHFKGINDTFGHDAGDAVLVEAAARLRCAVRESDCVARLGGDEFAILLITVTSEKGIEAVCNRIVDSVSGDIPFNDINLRTGCSVGIAMFPGDGDTQEGLYKSADLALYEAKRNNRNNFCWYHPNFMNSFSQENATSDCSSEAGLAK